MSPGGPFTSNRLERPGMIPPLPPTSAHMSRRGDRVAVVALLVLVIASWAPRWKGPIDLRWDAAVYYILGTSLSEGKGYRLLSEPGEIRAILYPPLLPLIVAAHQQVLGTTDPVIVGLALRRFYCLLFAALVFSTYALLRTAVRPAYALCGTFICGLTFLPVWLSDRCYTDVPFGLAIVCYALLSERSSSAVTEVSAWASAAAAFLFRTIGAAALLAWVAESILRRRYRQSILRFALAMLPILGWQLYVHHVQNGPDYVRPAYAYQRADYNIYNVTYAQLFSYRDHLAPELGKATAKERILRVPSAIPTIVVVLGGAISAPMTDWEAAVGRVKQIPVLASVVPWRSITLMLALLGALTFAGLIHRLLRGHLRLPIAVLVYSAGLATMPRSYFSELARYVSVIAPLAMLFALHALLEIDRRSQKIPRWVRRTAGTAGAALAAAILILNLGVVVRAYMTEHPAVVHKDWSGHRVEYRLFTYQSDYEDLDGGLEWLARHAAPTDVVASTTPHWVFLRTGLKAVLPPFEPDVARANELLDSVPVRYVIVLDWLSRRHGFGIVTAAPSIWKVAYSSGECTIYERIGSRAER
jgi:hypothetical protein